MRLIIAGGRDYEEQPGDMEWLDSILAEVDITEVISGCQEGADKLGERWARERGIKVIPFPARWRQDGEKAAGPIRNQRMADYAASNQFIPGALAVFPGNRGTRDMLQKALHKGLRVWKRHPDIGVFSG